MHPVTDQRLSPKAAASRAGCGRTSVIRALQIQELQGVRNNHGRWELDPAEVDRWAATRPVTDATESTKVQDTSGVDTLKEELEAAKTEAAELRTEAAELRGEVTGLRARLDDAHADRDRWHALATAPRPSLVERIRDAFRPRAGV